jgi:hypothetical protein
MDQAEAPLLDALNDYRASKRYGFTRPVIGRAAAPMTVSFPHWAASPFWTTYWSAPDSMTAVPATDTCNARRTSWRQRWAPTSHSSRPAGARISLPSPAEIQLETVERPRDAFFGRVETVSADKAAGRIAAEQITPYQPGIPAVVPGERLNDAVLEYLWSGARAGMNLPDAADASLQTIRVVA